MVVATGQHAGKTTTCLGLVSGLISRGQEVSFLKPVGQSWVEVDTASSSSSSPPSSSSSLQAHNDHNRSNLQHNVSSYQLDGHNTAVHHRVDKDCVLFKETFALRCPYPRMSPVLIPSGFTKQFLDGTTEKPETLLNKIRKDYEYLAGQSDVVVVEGTGHAGVGDIITMSNAVVAKTLGLKVVLVGTGGIGSAIDTLSLSKAVLEGEGVEIAGIILNKCLPEKPDVPDYVKKVVEGRWGVPFLGALMHSKVLGQATIRDFEILFRTKLIAAEEDALRRVDDVVLVASSIEAFVPQLDRPGQIFVTPASRTDVLFALLADLKTGGFAAQCGLILTGEPPQHSVKVLKLLATERLPTLLLPTMTSVEAIQKIAAHTAKIRLEDKEKIAKAIDVVLNGVDFERLMSSAL